MDTLSSCLRVLINVTHNNADGCAAVASCSVTLPSTLLSQATSVPRSNAAEPRVVGKARAGGGVAATPAAAVEPAAAVSGLHVAVSMFAVCSAAAGLASSSTATFDLGLMTTGLLTNLVEHSTDNRAALQAAVIGDSPVSGVLLATTSGGGGGNAIDRISAAFTASFRRMGIANGSVAAWRWPQDLAASVARKTTRYGGGHDPHSDDVGGDGTGDSNVHGDEVEEHGGSTAMTPRRGLKHALLADLEPDESDEVVDGVAVEDVISSGYLALLVGCSMRDCSDVASSIRRALPLATYKALGMTLGSFARLQVGLLLVSDC